MARKKRSTSDLAIPSMPEIPIVEEIAEIKEKEASIPTEGLIDAKIETKEITSAPKISAEPAPLVPLRVFERVSGLKWDQFAGFKSWAKLRGLGSMSILAWRAELKKFMERPIR